VIRLSPHAPLHPGGLGPMLYTIRLKAFRNDSGRYQDVHHPSPALAIVVTHSTSSLL
jgi:hypothetical protein